MICPQCGTENDNTRTECSRCHTRLRSPEMAGKIACANHPNREATTSCAACGIRLCEACAVNAGGLDFCDAHAPAGALRPAYEEVYERIPVVDPTRAARAGFASRAVALVADVLLAVAGAVVLALVFWLFSQSLDFLSSPQRRPVAFWTYWLALVLGMAAYMTILPAMTGQTLGKQMAGVIILHRDGRIISLRASFLRFLVSLISALPLGLGFLWVLWDPEKETWHDKAAGTRAFVWEEVG